MAPAIAEALDETARGALIAYVELLARWNRAYNLTAVREPLRDGPAPPARQPGGAALGCATGRCSTSAPAPGCRASRWPIARPGLAFTLLDSNGKKTRFVRQAVLELGLENVEVVQARLEAYRPSGKFATIVARALASAAELSGARAAGRAAAPGCWR